MNSPGVSAYAAEQMVAAAAAAPRRDVSDILEIL